MLGDPDDKDGQLVLPDWTFGLVVEADSNMFDGGFDAIIGMAYPNFAEEGVTPFFEALRQSGKLDKEVHSWYLSDNPDEMSEIMMGGWNEEKFDINKLEWHPVVHQLFWAVKLDDIKIGGKSTGLCQQKGVNCTVTPDSGTSMLTMPIKHLNKFKEMHGAFDCSQEDFNEIPEISYVIGGVEYSLPRHHWMGRVVDSNNEKGGRCETSISDLDVGFDGLLDMFILGD